MYKPLSLFVTILFFFEVALADIALPQPSTYVYTFEIAKKANKSYTFYCREKVYRVETLETNKKYYLNGIKPPSYSDRNKQVKDWEYSLKVWAQNNTTKAITDTLYFYTYYSEGNYGSNTIVNQVLLKKVSGNKIIYKNKKIKKGNWLPEAKLPSDNNDIRWLASVSFCAICIMMGIFFWRRRKPGKLSTEV